MKVTKLSVEKRYKVQHKTIGCFTYYRALVKRKFLFIPYWCPFCCNINYGTIYYGDDINWLLSSEVAARNIKDHKLLTC